MLVGYARVSTIDQNLDLQLSALKKAGCEKLYQDQMSGTKANRPGLIMALEILRKNDTLVVWKLCIAGSLPQIIILNPLVSKRRAVCPVLLCDFKSCYPI